jgi:two-component sensor histidine kinase
MFYKLRSYFVGGKIDHFESIHDKSRVALLFSLALLVTVMGLMAFVVSLIIGTYPVFIPAIGNMLFGTMTLLLLKFTKGFKVAAVFYFSVLTLLIFGNLLFNHGTMHVGAPFWIMLVNLLVMVVLGFRVGLIYLSISLIGFLYYLHYVFPFHMDIADTLTEQTYYSAYYEAFFALFLLAFIIFAVLKSSELSDHLLSHKNIELQRQNEMIRSRDEEKTIMLKEIHHRVKNNLQVITSLLRLQMYEIDNKVEAEKFNDSINRVMTMSLIHEKMYQSEELSRINLHEYFKGLSNDLLDSYQTDINVDLIIDLRIDRVGLKSIVPLALIYNELFSNSLKHAFEGVAHPKIQVSLDYGEEGYFVFVYQDNGSWKESNRSKSFGSELIASLTSQLEGEMKITTTPETSYEFRFKQLDI